MQKVNTLYISILGMSEPLGQSQVLEYVKDLSKLHNMSLYSFEKDLSKDTLEKLNGIMKKESIYWNYQGYSNKYGIFSTFIQIISSFLEIRKIIKEKNIQVIHARSLIPTIIALILKKFYNVKVIADIRGFQIDEKAEVGRIKKNSFLYKTLKKIEHYTYKKSDSIVSLTHAAINYIKNFTNENKVTVIPTCANDKLFIKTDLLEQNELKKELGYTENEIIILHAGAVSNWYDFDSELKIIKKLFNKDEKIRYLILNKSEHEFIEKKLSENDVDKSKVKVMESSFYDMYKYLNISDASIFVIKPTFAKLASAPTKFAENLCCGLYSITNNGIGDMNKFFEENKTLGYSFELSTLNENLEVICENIIQGIQLDKDYREYSKTYHDNFSKDTAIQKYSKIYNNLVEKR